MPDPDAPQIIGRDGVNPVIAQPIGDAETAPLAARETRDAVIFGARPDVAASIAAQRDHESALLFQVPAGILRRLRPRRAQRQSTEQKR